jgi:hypothetical protein
MEYNLYYPETYIGYILQFLTCFCFIGVIDKLFAPKRARWFFLHIFINSIVTIFSWKDVKLCITSPRKCFALESELSTTIPWMIGLTGHIYHMVAFKRLKLADYVHHILMFPVAGVAGFIYLRKPGFNYAIFGMTGLPGGIDYVLITLVKLGYLHWKWEKIANVWIQVWFRMPLLVMGAGIFLTEIMDGDLHYGCLIAVCLTIWNGIYYMHDTLANYYSKHHHKIYKSHIVAKTEFKTNVVTKTNVVANTDPVAINDPVIITDTISKTNAKTDPVAKTNVVVNTDLVAKTNVVVNTDLVAKTNVVVNTDPVVINDPVIITDTLSKTDTVAKTNAVTKN